MKIEQVKVILTSPNQNYLFVKLITDSGVYGVGDASLNGQEHTVADFITSFLTPILIGRDPMEPHFFDIDIDSNGILWLSSTSSGVYKVCFPRYNFRFMFPAKWKWKT